MTRNKFTHVPLFTQQKWIKAKLFSFLYSGRFNLKLSTSRRFKAKDYVELGNDGKEHSVLEVLQDEIIEPKFIEPKFRFWNMTQRRSCCCFVFSCRQINMLNV